MAATTRSERAFTLIELLVVICILSILIALSVAGVGVGINVSRANSTEAMLHDLSAAVVVYQTKWGDYPPTSIDEVGGRAPNDLNAGIESLVACLSSKKKGGPFFQKDEFLSNFDGDSAARNVTDSYFKTLELFEYKDHFDHPIIYFHHKDYEKPRPGLIRYKTGEAGDAIEVGPELHPTTKAPMNAGRFQLRSLGRDGKPGTADDLRAGQ